MTGPVIREVSVAGECPTMSHRVFLSQDEAQEERAVLIVAFEGRYRDGSEGNPDAAYMRGQIDLACGIWFHGGLVIDLSRLSYDWGDDILLALQNSQHEPCAIVVGPDCEGALATLLHDQNPAPPVTDFDDIFDSLEAALAHVRRPRPVWTSDA